MAAGSHPERFRFPRSAGTAGKRKPETPPTAAARARTVPLETVAKSLGFRPHPRDRAKWTRKGSIVSINGSKFFDHIAGQGGGGALDFVMHATARSFPEALEWLAGMPAETAAPDNPPQPRIRIPGPDPAQWPRLRDALAAERGIDLALLQQCHRRKRLHADQYGRAVFVCADAEGRPNGAEIAEPRPGGRKTMAPGSRKSLGAFWIAAGPIPPETVLIAESAVDALAARQLAKQPVTVASTAGLARRIPTWMNQWTPSQILCGYDADIPGDRAARHLAECDPRIRRLRPKGAADWCELLLKSETPGAFLSK